MNVSSTIDVDVDPMTAFTVFTDELDQWWGNGPIDAWDSSRCIGRRLEPGVGGRLLEVYEGDALELGRVTVWEPGARVCWQSSVDDVVIEVYFEPAGNGTRVRVDGIVPDGKTADAGLSFVRMTPEWLPRWMERRPAPRPELSRLNVIVHYAKPVAAAIAMPAMSLNARIVAPGNALASASASVLTTADGTLVRLPGSACCSTRAATTRSFTTAAGSSSR